MRSELHSEHQYSHLVKSELYDLLVLVLHDLSMRFVASSERR